MAGLCYNLGDVNERPVVVLGAGLTGLSCAYHLRDRPCVVFEREQRVGGKAISHRERGFTFDVTGHWLHLRDDRIKALVAEVTEPGSMVEIERKTKIASHGALLEYPFQANLHGLPLDVVQECLTEFLRARIDAATGPPPKMTFGAFVESRFGRGIARHFFIPYNEKLWGMPLDELTADWVSRFVPLPNEEQIVGGAIGLRQEGLGYNARFSYFRAGGIDHLGEALAAKVFTADGGATLELDAGVDAIQVDPDAPGRGRVKASSRPDWQAYDGLVSTMPLPELVARIENAPEYIRQAAARLRAVSWRYLDVATRRRPKADYHWVYVPERRYPFFRVGVYTNAVQSMAPPGGGSLYVELTDRSGEADEAEVVRALVELGAIERAQDVDFCRQRDVPIAYVVFDDDHAEAKSIVMDWLEQQRIRSCGRYGAWIYNSMEDSMLQGLGAAQEIAARREWGSNG